MTASLTLPGSLVAIVGGAFVFAGAVLSAWPLVAIGFAQIAALLTLYVLAFPRAAALRRQQMEVAWWVPAGEMAGGALLVDRPMALHLSLRNHTPFRVWVRQVRIMASSAIELESLPLGAVLAPGREAVFRIHGTPRAAGYWFFHGLSLSVSDRFGAFTHRLYFPNLFGIKVFPPLAVGREPIPFRPRTGALQERAGIRAVRQRGLGSDVRELRDHVPGDPFKHIAWKATARRRKLTVRDLESEIMVTHWLLLDISFSMRALVPGASKLDHGIALCAAYARSALTAGDRVGLLTFDHRIYSQVRPGDGRPQLYALIDRLMELHSVVDEDLTDFTDQELYAAVADYLAHQEGIAVTVPGRPPKSGDDPLWQHLALGPRGELFDLSAMERAVIGLLKKRRPTGASWWWNRVVSSSPRTAQLRLFCRLSGIELPYRQPSTVVRKETGMAEAIRRAAASRHSQLIVLVSDLQELEETRQIVDALRLARQRHHSVVVFAPFAPAFLSLPETPHAAITRNIYALRGERQRRGIRRAIESLGIPVLSAHRRDSLPLLLRRLALHRNVRRAPAASVGAPT